MTWLWKANAEFGVDLDGFGAGDLHSRGVDTYSNALPE